MPLTDPAADVVADNICSALGVTDTDTKDKWKLIMQNIYAGLKTDITVTTTITPLSINTAGGPAAQVGPPAPVPATSTVS